MVFLDFFILAGGLFSFILMLSKLIQKEKRNIDWVMAGVFFCVGVIITGKGLVTSGVVVNYPLFMHWDLFAYYLVSPVMYLFLRVYIHPEYRWQPRFLWNFLPFLLVLVLYLPFLILPGEEKILLFPYYLMVEDTLQPLYALSYFLPSIMIFIYSGLGLGRISVVNSIKQLFSSSPTRVIILLLLECVFLAVLMIVAYFYWNPEFYRIIFTCLTQVVLCFFLVDQRYPELTLSIQAVIEENRIPYSHLTGLNVEKLIREVNYYMERQRLYRDPNLSLNSFSRVLSISPHSLSELLNKRMGTNFPSLINQYRLGEVERCLIEEPERSILDIAFSAGFKSKSGFNTIFNTQVGMSPTEYRKNRPISGEG